jgi:hypothetical protein
MIHFQSSSDDKESKASLARDKKSALGSFSCHCIAAPKMTLHNKGKGKTLT